jgi:acyl-CoA thioesterase-1
MVLKPDLHYMYEHMKQQSIIAGLRFTLVLFASLALAFAFPTTGEARKEKQFFYSFKVVAYGDSFTSGYGIEPDQSYPIKLRKLLNEEFQRDRIEVINAGVSGDTASSAVSRLASILAEKPSIVIVAFGATDAMKRIDPDITYKALEQILSTLTYNNIYVLLCGFEAPQDAPVEFAARYNAVFPSLAKRYNVAYTPDFMKDVSGVWYNLQYDGLHPSEEGTDQIAKNMLKPTGQMVRKLRARLL